MRSGFAGLCALALASAGMCRAQEETGPAVTQPPVAGPASESQPAAGFVLEKGPRRFYQKVFTWQAVSATLPAAVIEQWHDWPAEWGKTDSGFGKRTASLFGQFVIGNAIEDGVQAIHPQDTRYRRMGTGNFFKRFSHVAVGTVIAGKAGGGHEPGYSRLANAYGSWAIATLWSPSEFRTPGSIAKWGTAGVGAMALSNLAREFGPGLKNLFRKTGSVVRSSQPN